MIQEDEILKSKLQEYKPEFDASHWDAMEKMLDKKSDKKPLFVWWKYGLAASLLLFGSAFAWIAIQHKSSRNHTSALAFDATFRNTFNKHNATQNTTTNNSTPLISNKKSVPTTNVPPTINSINNLSNTLSTLNQNKSHKQNKQSQISYPLNTPNSNTTKQIQLVPDNRYDNQTLLHLLAGGDIVTFQKLQNELLENTSAPNEFFVNTANSNQNKNSRNAKSATHIQQMSAPIQYGLTVLGGNSFTIDYESNKLNIYFDPISDISLLAEVRFYNRIGVYAGVGFAERKGGYSKKIQETTLQAYTDFTIQNNKISGVAIPMGVQTQLYRHPYIDLYCKTGITHIIPIRQRTFITYNTIPVVTPTESNNTRTIGNTVVSSMVDASGSYYQSGSTPDIAYSSTNHTESTYRPDEKYRAEVNLSLGINAKVTKNISFTFEPSYRIALKNKYNTSHQHSIAMSSGITFAF